MLILLHIKKLFGLVVAVVLLIHPIVTVYFREKIWCYSRCCRVLECTSDIDCEGSKRIGCVWLHASKLCLCLSIRFMLQHIYVIDQSWSIPFSCFTNQQTYHSQTRRKLKKPIYVFSCQKFPENSKTSASSAPPPYLYCLLPCNLVDPTWSFCVNY